MKRIYLFTTIVLLHLVILQTCYAQNTFISSIDRQSGSLNEIVTINGNGFDNNANNLRVFFGGALGNIISASTTIIEVEIPQNAAFDQISVINLANNTHVTSGDRFFISYSGEDFELGNIAAQSINPTGQRSVSDLCLCDFNLDNNSDIIVTSNSAEAGELGVFTIFSNNSTTGTIDLSQTDISLDEISFTDCGDLNGDGLPDLILSEGGSQNIRIYIFENTTTGSNITFRQSTTLELPNQSNGDISNTERVLMQDLDKDGRQDIIATTTSDNVIDIFRNIGAGTNIAFNPTPLQFRIEEGANTAGLDSYDLNNDGFDEIILTSSREQDIYILPNTSSVGNIIFDDFITIDVPGNGNLTTVKAGDFNNDGFADLVSINDGTLGSANDDFANIFLNTTNNAGEEIQFSQLADIPINIDPGGIDLGDLNGDGRLDIAISSLDRSTNGLSVLINNSSGSNLVFDFIEIPTTSSSRNIRINDIDGDGRPDIAFTHNIGGTDFGDLSIFLNQNCITPEISPEQNQTICLNNDLELQATQSIGATYRWDLSVNGGGFATVQESLSSTINVQTFLNSGEIGEFRTTIITDGGSCQMTSETTFITIDGGSAAAPILNLPSGNNICPGDELVLSSNIPNDGSVLFEWTAPDGATSTEAVFRRPDFQPSFAGRYELVIISSSSCRSPVGSIVVGSRNVPFIQIDNGGFSQICQGEGRDLSVPLFDGFDYQWRLNGVNITGANTNTFTAINPGTYSLMITDETMCDFETRSITLTSIQPPVASFTVDPLICEGLPLAFNATSTGEGTLRIINSWEFGDTQTATGDNPTNIYATAGRFNATLVSEYADLPGCNNSTAIPIVVRAPQEFPIMTPDGTEKCPSDVLTLALPDNFQSYNWSTGDTTPTTTAGTETGLSSNTITVDYTDDAGCVENSSIEISNFPNSELIIESNLTLVDDTVRLGENDASVDLFISFGTEPFWEPASIIENNESTEVTVFPSAAFTTITLTATTSNACRETKSVVVVNNSVVPRRTFSPNGDGRGFECWEILNAQILQSCTIYIFDSKGLIVQEVSSPFDSNNCIWDGTSNGRAVPEGVYYYVLKCNDSEFNDTGSILLAR